MFYPKRKLQKAGEEFLLLAGFLNLVNLPTKNPSSKVIAFSYDRFEPEKVRAFLGKPTRFSSSGLFLFKVAADKAIRVNTEKKTLLLVNSKPLVSNLMRKEL